MDWTMLKGEWAYFTGAFITIFFIIDPFAVIPTYLSLTERYSDPERRSVRMRAVFIAFGLLVMFAISGTTFFEFFGITLPAFQIAGGILLFAQASFCCCCQSHLFLEPLWRKPARQFSRGQSLIIGRKQGFGSRISHSILRIKEAAGQNSEPA